MQPVTHPTRVRQKILDQHGQIREQLDLIDGLLSQVREHATLNPEIVSEASNLLHFLSIHIKFEEGMLESVLPQTDAWGDERLVMLKSEHVKQQSVIRNLIGQLERHSVEAPNIYSVIRNFIDELREDMRSEEEFFLDPYLLRDELTQSDVFTG